MFSSNLFSQITHREFFAIFLFLLIIYKGKKKRKYEKKINNKKEENIQSRKISCGFLDIFFTAIKYGQQVTAIVLLVFVMLGKTLLLT